MKRNLFMMIAFSLCVATPLVAQNIIREGARWYYGLTDAVSLETSTTIYLLEGDTVVDGKRYLKEKATTQEDYTKARFCGTLYREEHGKVFYYDVASKEENVLFDLTLQEDESYLYVDVLNKDTIRMTFTGVSEWESTMSSLPRKCWNFVAERILNGEPLDFNEAHIVEGIGDVQFGIQSLSYGVVGGAIGLSCCYDGENNLIFGSGQNCYVNTLSIDEVKDEAGGVKITENSGGRLSFTWNAGAAYRTLSLYTANGQLVARRRLAQDDTEAAFVNLQKGVYLYYFTAGGQTKAAGKVLVE